jgi:FkbM family methyltransferase
MKLESKRARFVKRIIWIGMYLVVICFLAVEGIWLAPASLRTKAYFGFIRMLYPHWPHKPDGSMLLPYARAFEPFVPVWIRVEPGVTMRLDPHDLVSTVILATGGWEPETWRALKPHLPVGGTFIDVGAQIGWYSLRAARVVGPTGRVIAVEPNRETLTNLRDNIRASVDDKVIVVAPVACSDSEGTMVFYPGPRSNTGASSLSLKNAEEDGPVSTSYPVHTRRLDDIVKEAGITRVDAVKIDVQGAELLVLKGAVGTLERYRPVICLELYEPDLESMGTSAQQVIAFMMSHGYKQKSHEEENMIFVAVAAP